jgi:hypothetical protein
MINDERLSLAQVHTFNMDEYADQDGVTAPPSWPGSFQRAMWERFFALVDPELRPSQIGPREILGARHRSFWLDGDLGGGVSWQRFIARLVAHGPVGELVPGSLLQEARSDYTILGNVADDVTIQMS